MKSEGNKTNVSERITYNFKIDTSLLSDWMVRSLPFPRNILHTHTKQNKKQNKQKNKRNKLPIVSSIHHFTSFWNILMFSRGKAMILFYENKATLDNYSVKVNPVFRPWALMTMILRCRSMKGWIRQSRGSCFWLRQMPLWFTTIQLRSYSSPWLPRGHLVT